MLIARTKYPSIQINSVNIIMISIAKNGSIEKFSRKLSLFWGKRRTTTIKEMEYYYDILIIIMISY